MSIKLHTSNWSEIIRTHISKKRSRRLAARAYFWHSERGSSVVSALASGARGPKFNLRSLQGKFWCPNSFPLCNLQG